MATVNLSVPDEMKRAFDRAFRDQNKSAVIADHAPGGCGWGSPAAAGGIVSLVDCSSFETPGGEQQ